MIMQYRIAKRQFVWYLTCGINFSLLYNVVKTFAYVIYFRYQHKISVKILVVDFIDHGPVKVRGIYFYLTQYRIDLKIYFLKNVMLKSSSYSDAIHAYELWKYVWRVVPLEYYKYLLLKYTVRPQVYVCERWNKNYDNLFCAVLKNSSLCDILMYIF